MSTDRYPSINIIGAGIAGLTLACHLRRRRIPFAIFDAASRPKGHNYGITISPWGYADVLGVLEPKLDAKTFRELSAVDRSIGGYGVTTTLDKNGGDFRASDMVLREVLAKGHQINWNHKVVSAESVAEGLRLEFENGEARTANITIDAGGERSGLMALLLPGIDPEILPYAVYHGSRYVSQSTFQEDYDGIFAEGENVRYFTPPTSSPKGSSPLDWHLQIAKSYIARDQVPSKAVFRDEATESNASDIVVELRYTFSRPASSPSPLFNPSRSPSAAIQTPATFYDSVEEYLSTNSSLPATLVRCLSRQLLREDRILNWLMRVRPQLLDPMETRQLASNYVIAIGDSMHATPPVMSYGANAAMVDAGKVVKWVEETVVNRDASPENMISFYEERLPYWKEAIGTSKERLQAMHALSQGERLSGRM